MLVINHPERNSVLEVGLCCVFREEYIDAVF